MLSLRRSTASTRPSASTGPTPTAGTTSATTSWPRSRGCTGSTKNVFTATAATSRQRSSKQRSTLATNLPCRGLETNSESLHQTQGDSDFGAESVPGVSCPTLDDHRAREALGLVRLSADRNLACPRSPVIQVIHLLG